MNKDPDSIQSVDQQMGSTSLRPLLALFERYPSQAVEHFFDGVAFSNEKRFHDALGEFKLAIAASPQPFIEAYAAMAEAYRDLSDDPVAVMSAYKKVVELDSTQTPSWCWLAWIAFFFRQSDEKSGEKDSRKAIREYRNLEQTALAHVRQQFPTIDPGRDRDKYVSTIHAINSLADTYADKDYINEAAEWYQLVAEVKPETVVIADEDGGQDARFLADAVSHARRRRVLVQERITKSAEAYQRLRGEGRKRTLIWLGVAVVIIIVLLVLCNATMFVPYQ